MAILLFPKVYKGLTSFQLLDDILFCLRSLGSVGTGEKGPAMGLSDWRKLKPVGLVTPVPMNFSDCNHYGYPDSEMAFQAIIFRPWEGTQ